MVNANDPFVETLPEQYRARLIVLDNEDPTTEVLARRIYEYVSAQIKEGGSYTDPSGNRFTLPTHLVLERLRVSETSTSWAEYGTR
jgi:6-pyruvoyltetrahydropterin/6-carboxytetrahydropterin synthase